MVRQIELKDAGVALPQKLGTNYIVYCLPYAGGALYPRVASFASNLYEVDDCDFRTKKNEPGWYAYSSEYGYYQLNNVIYWAELPIIEKLL